METEKSAEAMWKQIFSDSKIWPVNWKLKRNINPRWERNAIKNTGVFLSILGII